MRITREKRFKLLQHYAGYLYWHVEGSKGTELRVFEDCLKCIYSEEEVKKLRAEAKMMVPNYDE